ncbi:hypothetical protein FACS1894190_09980 [Spirochaetia bacterium]|nr:hypothetical protein FACS1894190_09980 [Spirochaetia bacterium]
MKMSIRPIVFCLFLVSTPCFTFAASVSVLVVETGLNESSVNGLADIWESGIMDVLFNAGHIVCNSTPLYIPEIADEEIPSKLYLSLEEAEEGGVEYFLIAMLNYGNRNEVKNARPDQITLKLFNVTYKNILYTQNIDKPETRTYRDEFSNAQKAARIIMPYLGGKV